MRLVGPGCFGIAVPGIGLDATFAARHPAAGTAGLVMQSGGLGFALADRLSRLGVGVSSFASVGSKYDVSGNDMLVWWEQDQATKLAVLYIESFGNPRKFARTARRVGRTMPVLTVPAGRSAGRPAHRRGPHRGGRHRAGDPCGPVPAGRHHRHRQPRRARRRGRPAGHPARPGRPGHRHRVEHQRRRACWPPTPAPSTA